MSLGIHCDRQPKANLTESLKITFAVLATARCAQIFTHGPRTWAKTAYDEVELKKICDTYNIYTHQTYVTSWKPEPRNIQHMQDQFTAADDVGAQGVVLHLAKISPEDHIKVLKQLRPGGAMIILEMRALKLDQYSYQSAAEINQLCKALKAAGYTSNQVIICLDTAHLSAGGIKLTTKADARAYIDSLKYPSYIGLLHLNGNEYDPSVRAGDKHCTPLGKEDFVFRDVTLANSGCLELARWFIGRDRDVILEQSFNPKLQKVHKAISKLI